MVLYLSLGELRLDGRPCLGLSSIGEEVHDDGTLRDGLVDFEQVGAGNPAILLCLFPRGAILAHANDDIQTVVAEVETLTMTLGAVADEGEGVVLEIFLKACQLQV